MTESGGLAADWNLAPHRTASLVDIVRDRRRADPAFDARVRGTTGSWPAEEDLEQDLRLETLKAHLDPANFHEVTDEETGDTGFAFDCPADLRTRLEAQQRDADPPEEQGLSRLHYFASLLREPGLLAADASTALYEQFESNNNVAIDEERRPALRAVLIALLLAKDNGWLAANPQAPPRILEALYDIIDARAALPKEGGLRGDDALAGLCGDEPCLCP